MNDLEDLTDQSIVEDMVETKELVGVYRKILRVMYKEEFALQYEELERFKKLFDKAKDNRSKKEKIKNYIGDLYFNATTTLVNTIVRLSLYLHIKSTFKKIRLLNSLESLSLLDSSKWSTQETLNPNQDLQNQNPQNTFTNTFTNTFYKKLNDEMQYIEDLLPDFKEYFNNYIVLGIIAAIITPIIAIITLLFKPPFEGGGWISWIIFGLMWIVIIVILLLLKNKIKKEVSRIYSESMEKYNKLIEPAREIERRIFMKDQQHQQRTDQENGKRSNYGERGNNNSV